MRRCAGSNAEEATSGAAQPAGVAGIHAFRAWVGSQPAGELRIVLLASTVYTGEVEVWVQMRPSRTRHCKYQRAAVLREKCDELLDHDFDQDKRAPPDSLTHVRAWISGVPGSFVLPHVLRTPEQDLRQLRARRAERKRNEDVKAAYAAALQRTVWRESKLFIFTCTDCGAATRKNDHCYHCNRPLCRDCMFDEDKLAAFLPRAVARGIVNRVALCLPSLKQHLGTYVGELWQEWQEVCPGKPFPRINDPGWYMPPFSLDAPGTARLLRDMRTAETERTRTAPGVKRLFAEGGSHGAPQPTGRAHACYAAASAVQLLLRLLCNCCPAQQDAPPTDRGSAVIMERQDDITTIWGSETWDGLSVCLMHWQKSRNS